MKKISRELLQKIKKEVKKEFPYDEMMQELHLIRWLTWLETKDMSTEEKMNYFNSAKDR